jgi:hypothetical protein
MKRNIQELQDRYMFLMHAVQSGVAMTMNYDTHPTEPKHLRTGINSALVNQAAVVRLLVAKGIITEEEYYEALVKEAEAEVRSYEQALSERLKAKITLA